MADPVNHPSHYNQGGIECIDAIKSMLGKEGFIAYCQGNAAKYLWRHQYKGKKIEDLQKAQWYQNRIMDILRLEALDELTWETERLGLYEHQQKALGEKYGKLPVAESVETRTAEKGVAIERNVPLARDEPEPNTGWNPNRVWCR